MALTPFLRHRKLRFAALLGAVASVSLTSAQAQEEGPDAPETGYSSLDVAQPRGTRELQNALQRLALYPGDIDALIDAGNAALLLQDPQAAIGFFARADEMSPGNGRVKAGLGSALLLNENPYEALRLFDEAKRLGVPETVYAADRGLAYDLVGNSNAAQDDYELALRRGADDETIRRYALSLGISGDRAAAEAQLDPLLRKRDAAAWRTRAFVLAVSGDAEGAIAIADATMPKRMAASIEPFFRFMGRLTPAQQAAAAHFGHFPAAAAVGKDDPRNRQYASLGTPRVRSGRADAGLIPAGEPLGPTPETKSRRVAKVDKSQRRIPGKLSKKEREAIALAQAQAAAQPVPVQTRAPGPVPPPDLLMPGRGTSSAPSQQTIQTIQNVQTARATVQPLPGSRATVQSLPDSSAASRNAAAAPANVARGGGDRPALATNVQSGVQPDRPADNQLALATSVRVTDLKELPAPSSARDRATQGPLIGPDDKVVVLSGMTELPRPGFTSVANPTAATTSATPPPPPATSAPGSAAPTGLAGSAVTSTNAVAPGQAPLTLSSSSPAAASATTASAGASPATVQPLPSAPEPARISLASVIASIQVPAAELAPADYAVDVTKLPPAPKKPDEKELAVKKAEEDKKLADKKLADKKAADKLAAEKKAAAAKKAEPKHPKRYWVQVAGGANRADLSKEWKRLTTTSPALFKGKQGWWTPLNATNRLLTGPFKSADEAQAFVNTLAKNKLSGFTFTSPAGQEVTALGK
ncbi:MULTISPECIES: SPOR domain-containing protein [Sphingomonadaceae]|jgi:tetratricopeptide (TPR) repeat protein|uniref:SPOR domain-containing protein n=1 Tax=Sphingomonadales TaxID=204457 RepID=UPI00076AE3E3|nr:MULTISPECIES: SPOR domain-containing protein [Sphingomonadaceae]MAF61079.1 SPOR domain-containing protein [Blastomonas sp.]|tara:strand:+ start:55432 stop:57702 length:2271 start_codon:yes stop_codon:yes gene_type:complete